MTSVFGGLGLLYVVVMYVYAYMLHLRKHSVQKFRPGKQSGFLTVAVLEKGDRISSDLYPLDHTYFYY